jgi:hypothetical protein
MKFKLTIAASIGFLLFCSMFVKGQATTNFTQSQLNAAERVVVASGLKESMKKMFDQVVVMQSKQLPEDQRDAFASAMNKFLDKYVGWEQLKAAFIPIYASEFTEDELNKIADFMETPAGKAMMDKQSELFQKGSAWGMKTVQDHSGELEQMMKDASSGKSN